MVNGNLQRAKQAKNDEFYTQLTDIERELRHYRRHFKNKTVLCNCDDPFESMFFKYFAMNFNRLKLKKLICTCYAGSPISGSKLERPNGAKAYKAVINAVYDADGNGYIDMEDIRVLFELGENELSELSGDGSFSSPECIELLKEADVVVTNPPFSQFRTYVALLMEYKKKFLIIGNINAVTYKEFFPLIKDNKVWIGASIHSGDRKFYVPDDYPLEAAGCGIDKDTGRKFIRVKGVRWYTNLDIRNRHDMLDLVEEYDPAKYPKYDNYDAIEVPRTNLIPCDYEGVMGVPITFLDKYCPEQFEIIDINPHFFSLVAQGKEKPRQLHLHNAGRKDPYARILIRNKCPEIIEP